MPARLCLIAAQTFSCDELAGTDEKSYLRADYSLECFTDTHTSFMVRRWLAKPLGANPHFLLYSAQSRFTAGAH
jgi:hypothetical protein